MPANASRTGSFRWNISFILTRNGAVCYGDGSYGWRGSDSSVTRRDECVAVVLGPDRRGIRLGLTATARTDSRASSAERLKRLFSFMATPELCVTVTAPTMADLRRQRDAVGDADLVELRLDTVRDPSVAGALEGRTRPVVITCRAAWEGGGFTGSEEERRRILSEALESGAEYVDIEWRARIRRSGQPGRAPCRAVVPQLRRHDTRSGRAAAGDARRDRRHRESRGHAAAPGRLRAAAGARRRGFARQPNHRDWYGRLRPGDAPARRRASAPRGPTPARCATSDR